MEKKLYIQSDDLGVIMEALAAKALDHVGDMNIETSIRRVCHDTILDVVVRSNDYERLATATYYVLDEVQDYLDVIDQTIGSALVKMDQNAMKKEEVTPSNEEE